MERRLAEMRAANRRREAQLRGRKQRLEAAKRARRLILMGSYMEHAIERDTTARERLLRKLDGALFDLPPRVASDG